MAAIASLNVNAVFGKKAPAKKAPAKKTAAKKAPVRSAGVKRQGNIGPNRTLWNGWESNPEPPAYLDGSLPGDAGFDPFGLSKPVEYLQFDLDGLDGSAAVNPYGRVIGKLKKVDNKPTERTIVVRQHTRGFRASRARAIAFSRLSLRAGNRRASRASPVSRRRARAQRTPREALASPRASERASARTRARPRRDRARCRLAGFRRCVENRSRRVSRSMSVFSGLARRRRSPVEPRPTVSMPRR